MFTALAAAPQSPIRARGRTTPGSPECPARCPQLHHVNAPLAPFAFADDSSTRLAHWAGVRYRLLLFLPSLRSDFLAPTRLRLCSPSESCSRHPSGCSVSALLAAGFTGCFSFKPPLYSVRLFSLSIRYRSIHCSRVRLWSVGTRAVRSSQSVASRPRIAVSPCSAAYEQRRSSSSLIPLSERRMAVVISPRGRKRSMPHSGGR